MRIDIKSQSKDLRTLGLALIIIGLASIFLGIPDGLTSALLAELLGIALYLIGLFAPQLVNFLASKQTKA